MITIPFSAANRPSTPGIYLCRLAPERHPFLVEVTESQGRLLTRSEGTTMPLSDYTDSASWSTRLNLVHQIDRLSTPERPPLSNCFVFTISPESHYAQCVPGSAIVAADLDPTTDSLDCYFEGNIYGAPALATFEARAFTALGRLLERYPTAARARIPRSELRRVGHYEGNSLKDLLFVPEIPIREFDQEWADVQSSFEERFPSAIITSATRARELYSREVKSLPNNVHFEPVNIFDRSRASKDNPTGFIASGDTQHAAMRRALTARSPQ